MILSSKIHYGMFKSAGAKCSHVFSMLSPFGLAALIGVAGVWALETAPSQTVITTNNVIDVNTGSDVDIQIPVVVHSDMRRAVYRMSIADEQGSTVYQFPDREAADPRSLDLRTTPVQLPALKKGLYTLHVQVIYPFNPLKNGNIFMSVATLNVNK